jgi:hypothetical protein
MPLQMQKRARGVTRASVDAAWCVVPTPRRPPPPTRGKSSAGLLRRPARRFLSATIVVQRSLKSCRCFEFDLKFSRKKLLLTVPAPLDQYCSAAEGRLGAGARKRQGWVSQNSRGARWQNASQVPECTRAASLCQEPRHPAAVCAKCCVDALCGLTAARFCPESDCAAVQVLLRQGRQG